MGVTFDEACSMQGFSCIRRRVRKNPDFILGSAYGMEVRMSIFVDFFETGCTSSAPVCYNGKGQILPGGRLDVGPLRRLSTDAGMRLFGRLRKYQIRSVAL